MSFWDFFFLMLIYVPLLLMWGVALADIFRRDDMAGITKAVWVVAVILVPFFGTLIYLILRRPGATPEERAVIDQAGRQVVAQQSPDDPLHQLAMLSDLRERGALTDEEFAAEKARVLGSTGSAPAAPTA